MLTQQYLDNWAYQANIRKDIYRMKIPIRTDNVRYSGDLNERLESYLGERIQDFGEKYLKIDPRTVKATFPGAVYLKRILLFMINQWYLLKKNCA